MNPAQQLQDDIPPRVYTDAQYLATLDHIEAQRECFFDVMGELQFDAMQWRAAHVGRTA
jgi:hypothetical protein